MWKNNNQGGWGGVPFNNQPRYNNNQYNGYPQPQNKKKHSGAKTKRYTPTQGTNKGVEMTHTHGWMFRKRTGLTTFSCNTTSKSKLKDSGWVGSIACEVVSENGQKSFYWGTMEYKTGKVVIADLGIVVSPKGGKGGYTGKFSQ